MPEEYRALAVEFYENCHDHEDRRENQESQRGTYDIKQSLRHRAGHSLCYDLQIESFCWGVPPQNVLDQAVALRRRLDAQRETLGANAGRMLLVVGKARFTPADIRLAEGGVEYLDAPEDGDGRVTFANACLPGVKTWQVDVVHGDLADAQEAFDAYVELLATGETARLPVAAPAGATRGAVAERPVAALVPSRPARVQRGNEPPASLGDVFAVVGERQAKERPADARLRVSVVNGNLKFISQPLMLGHYQSLAQHPFVAHARNFGRGA